MLRSELESLISMVSLQPDKYYWILLDRPTEIKLKMKNAGVFLFLISFVQSDACLTIVGSVSSASVNCGRNSPKCTRYAAKGLTSPPLCCKLLSSARTSPLTSELSLNIKLWAVSCVEKDRWMPLTIRGRARPDEHNPHECNVQIIIILQNSAKQIRIIIKRKKPKTQT